MLEAVVLAGGLGTRLRAAVPELPKPMAPVNGRPFLHIVLDMLARQGFSRVVLSVGYMAEKISGYFGESCCGIEIAYAVEESPLGTGGGLRMALERAKSDSVFVLNGDTYVDFNVSEAQALKARHDGIVVIGVQVEDAARYGRMVMEDDRVVGFSEKGATGPGVINAGCYLLERDAMSGFPTGQVFSFEEQVLLPAVHQGSVWALRGSGRFIDIGVPEDYARAQSLFRSEGLG